MCKRFFIGEKQKKIQLLKKSVFLYGHYYLFTLYKQKKYTKIRF